MALLPFVLVVVILTIRMLRPQRISLTRMWIQPIVLCGVAGLSIYAGETLHPAPFWQLGVGMAAGALAGIPFGMLRGQHTDVKPTDRHNVMLLGSSWMTMAVFLAAFGIRYVARTFAPAGALSTVVGDAALAFAIAMIATSYVVIYRKYEAALAATGG